jgi:hypothetical protein
MAQQDRDATPEALIESLSHHVPEPRGHTPGVLVRLRPILAMAAVLALLATSLVLLNTPARNTPDSIIDTDLVAALESDLEIFEDGFIDTLASLESELLETEQRLASWDSDQLWEDSQLLWQEVVQ